MDIAIKDPGTGAVVGSQSLSDAVFGVPYNEALVHQVVVAYAAAARAGTRAQKNRSDVRGGGAKPWRQKGTGRARAGSSRSPIWRKGGVTFAARPQNFEQKVNRKMYRGALRSILSELLRQDRLILVGSLDFDRPHTRTARESLGRLGFDTGMLVVNDVSEALYLSIRNLPQVGLCDHEGVDPLSLVGSEKVLLTTQAAKALEARLQ
jgi:large subunit ribosomal protein L4